MYDGKASSQAGARTRRGRVGLPCGLTLGVAMAVAVAAVVAGCGGSGGGGDTTTIIREQAAPSQPAPSEPAPTPKKKKKHRASPSDQGGGGGKTVPDEVGERLDVAEDDLDERGIRFKEVGGGSFGIVVRSNWEVCETRPAAGQPVGGAVKLIVDRPGAC